MANSLMRLLICMPIFENQEEIIEWVRWEI